LWLDAIEPDECFDVLGERKEVEDLEATKKEAAACLEPIEVRNQTVEST
jgi:hypothetical protein